MSTDGGLSMGMLFRHRKAQNWDYVAHLRGVAVVMNV